MDSDEMKASCLLQERIEKISNLVEKLQDPLKCMICLDLLTGPVTTKCDHNYCAACIHGLLSQSRGPTACPLCQTPITKRSLESQPRLVKLVEAVRSVITSIKQDCGLISTPSKKCSSRQSKYPSLAENSDEEEMDEPRRGTRHRTITPGSYADSSLAGDAVVLSGRDSKRKPSQRGRPRAAAGAKRILSAPDLPVLLAEEDSNLSSQVYMNKMAASSGNLLSECDENIFLKSDCNATKPPLPSLAKGRSRGRRKVKVVLARSAEGLSDDELVSVSQAAPTKQCAANDICCPLLARSLRQQQKVKDKVCNWLDMNNVRKSKNKQSKEKSVCDNNTENDFILSSKDTDVTTAFAKNDSSHFDRARNSIKFNNVDETEELPDIESDVANGNNTTPKLLGNIGCCSAIEESSNPPMPHYGLPDDPIPNGHSVNTENPDTLSLKLFVDPLKTELNNHSNCKENPNYSEIADGINLIRSPVGDVGACETNSKLKTIKKTLKKTTAVSKLVNQKFVATHDSKSSSGHQVLSSKDCEKSTEKFAYDHVVSSDALLNVDSVIERMPPPIAPSRKRVIKTKVALKAGDEKHSNCESNAITTSLVTHNTRFASQVKKLLSEHPKVSACLGNKKSPGWSHIAVAKKDLNSKHKELNITGGDCKLKITRLDQVSVDKTLGYNALQLSEESSIEIDDQTQKFDVEHLQIIPGRDEHLAKLKAIVRNSCDEASRSSENNQHYVDDIHSETHSSSKTSSLSKDVFSTNMSLSVKPVVPITVPETQTTVAHWAENTFDATDGKDSVMQKRLVNANQDVVRSLSDVMAATVLSTTSTASQNKSEISNRRRGRGFCFRASTNSVRGVSTKTKLRLSQSQQNILATDATLTGQSSKSSVSVRGRVKRTRMTSLKSLASCLDTAGPSNVLGDASTEHDNVVDYNTKNSLADAKLLVPTDTNKLKLKAHNDCLEPQSSPLTALESTPSAYCQTEATNASSLSTRTLSEEGHSLLSRPLTSDLAQPTERERNSQCVEFEERVIIPTVFKNKRLQTNIQEPTTMCEKPLNTISKVLYSVEVQCEPSSLGLMDAETQTDAGLPTESVGVQAQLAPSSFHTAGVIPFAAQGPHCNDGCVGAVDELLRAAGEQQQAMHAVPCALYQVIIKMLHLAPSSACCHPALHANAVGANVTKSNEGLITNEIKRSSVENSEDVYDAVSPKNKTKKANNENVLISTMSNKLTSKFKSGGSFRKGNRKRLPHQRPELTAKVPKLSISTVSDHKVNDISTAIADQILPPTSKCEFPSQESFAPETDSRQDNVSQDIQLSDVQTIIFREKDSTSRSVLSPTIIIERDSDNIPRPYNQSVPVNYISSKGSDIPCQMIAGTECAGEKKSESMLTVEKHFDGRQSMSRVASDLQSDTYGCEAANNMVTVTSAVSNIPRRTCNIVSRPLTRQGSKLVGSVLNCETQLSDMFASGSDLKALSRGDVPSDVGEKENKAKTGQRCSSRARRKPLQLHQIEVVPTEDTKSSEVETPDESVHEDVSEKDFSRQDKSKLLKASKTSSNLVKSVLKCNGKGIVANRTSLFESLSREISPVNAGNERSDLSSRNRRFKRIRNFSESESDDTDQYLKKIKTFSSSKDLPSLTIGSCLPVATAILDTDQEIGYGEAREKNSEELRLDAFDDGIFEYFGFNKEKSVSSTTGDVPVTQEKSVTLEPGYEELPELDCPGKGPENDKNDSSEEEEIPGTLEVLKNVALDVARIRRRRRMGTNEVELLSQDTVVLNSTQGSLDELRYDIVTPSLCHSPNSTKSCLTALDLQDSSQITATRANSGELLRRCERSLKNIEELLHDPSSEVEISKRPVSSSASGSPAVKSLLANISQGVKIADNVTSSIVTDDREVRVSDDCVSQSSKAADATAANSEVRSLVAGNSEHLEDDMFAAADTGDHANRLNPIRYSPSHNKNIGKRDYSVRDGQLGCSSGSCKSPAPLSTANKLGEVNKTSQRLRVLMVCTGLTAAEGALVLQLSLTLGQSLPEGVKVIKNWRPDVTHVIVSDKTTERTLKYLYGVASGCWVLDVDWVKTCLEQRCIVSEEPFEALDYSNTRGPARGRMHRGAVLKDVTLCCVPPFDSITLSQIKELVQLCGGRVVDSPEELTEDREKDELTRTTQLIVLQADEDCSAFDNTNGEANVSETRRVAASLALKHCRLVVASDWLVESIATVTRVSIEPYLLCSPNETLRIASGVSEALMAETQDLLSLDSQGKYRTCSSGTS